MILFSCNDDNDEDIGVDNLPINTLVFKKDGQKYVINEDDEIVIRFGANSNIDTNPNNNYNDSYFESDVIFKKNEVLYNLVRIDIGQVFHGVGMYEIGGANSCIYCGGAFLEFDDLIDDNWNDEDWYSSNSHYEKVGFINIIEYNGYYIKGTFEFKVTREIDSSTINFTDGAFHYRIQ